jgi:multiple sugar transport system permease protein
MQIMAVSATPLTSSVVGSKAKTPGWRIRQAIVTYTALIPYVAFSLFPLYIMFITSFKSKQEINNLGNSPFWATGITTENYVYLATHTHFFDHWLFNTIIVAVVATAISVTVGVLAAYALARLKFRGVEAFGVAVFITYLVPQSLLFLPLIEVINFVDTYIMSVRDSYWSLIITYPTFLIPFVTWLLMGYFRTVPFEVEECAYIDGCSRVRTLVQIVLPMALPGVACAILFSFTLCWNEFLYSLVFIQDQFEKTISIGVFTELVRGDIYFWGSLMAACLTGCIPILVIYAFFMDYFVTGLTAGAIK